MTTPNKITAEEVRRIFHNFDWQTKGLVVDLKFYESDDGVEYCTLAMYRDNYDNLDLTPRLIIAQRSLVLRELIQNAGMRCELEVDKRVPKRR